MIEATITEIEPEARYQGQIYTQTVKVSIEQDSTVELFDGTVPIATDELVGELVEVLIEAQPKAISRTDTKQIGIELIDEGNYEVIGTICNSTDKELAEGGSFVLDIGHGTISVQINGTLREQIGNVEENDKILVNAYRLDLIDIEHSN